MDTTMKEVETERDFYFEKLRDVEVIVQVHQEQGHLSDPVAMVEKVFRILYATAEDKLTVGDDGDIIEAGKFQDELELDDLLTT